MNPKKYRDVIQKTAVHPEGNALFIPPNTTKEEIENIDGEDLKKLLLGEKPSGTVPIQTVDIGTIYALMGLVGEAGEMANKQKKRIRGDKNPPNPYDELNDVRWYVENLARLSGRKPGELETENTEKLLDRKERGVLKGTGDKR